MIEESDSPVAPRETAPDARYGESLLYDFAKFIISLSLLALGGMLTLSQAVRTGEVERTNLLLVLGSISVAAIAAFSVAHALVDARARGTAPASRLLWTLRGSTLLLGIGIGGFLKLWLDTLS